VDVIADLIGDQPLIREATHGGPSRQHRHGGVSCASRIRALRRWWEYLWRAARARETSRKRRRWSDWLPAITGQSLIGAGCSPAKRGRDNAHRGGYRRPTVIADLWRDRDIRRVLQEMLRKNPQRVIDRLAELAATRDEGAQIEAEIAEHKRAFEVERRA
jgi:hypothetical protein